MTDALTEYAEAEAAPVAAIADPIERFEAAKIERSKHGAADRALMEIQKAVVWELYEPEGRTWADVGKLLGFSGSRAEAIARGR
jgi:hypothetical protein